MLRRTPIDPPLARHRDNLTMAAAAFTQYQMLRRFHPYLFSRPPSNLIALLNRNENKVQLESDSSVDFNRNSPN